MEKQQPTSTSPFGMPLGGGFYPFGPFPPEEPFDLKKSLQRVKGILVMIWQEKVKLIQITSISFLFGLLYLLAQPTLYTAELRLIPYQSGSSGSFGGLAGLAGLAGIKVPTSGSGQQGNVLLVPHYSELIKSHNFLTEIVNKPIYFKSLNKEISYTEYFTSQKGNSIAQVFQLIRSYTLGLPGKVFGLFTPTEQVGSVSNAPKELLALDKDYEEMLEGFKELVAVSVDEETAIIDISVQLQDPYAAAGMAKLLSEELKKQIILFETQKDEEQVRYLGEQQAIAKERYQKAQRTLAAYTDRNRGTYSALDQVGLQAVQSDFNLAFQLYSNLSVELDAAKVKKAKDTPSFSIFQTPTVPLEPSSPRRGRTLGVSILVGLLLFGVWFVVKRYDTLFPTTLPEE